jgi:hypothetical protein
VGTLRDLGHLLDYLIIHDVLYIGSVVAVAGSDGGGNEKFPKFVH